MPAVAPFSSASLGKNGGKRHTAKEDPQVATRMTIRICHWRGVSLFLLVVLLSLLSSLVNVELRSEEDEVDSEAGTSVVMP